MTILTVLLLAAIGMIVIAVALMIVNLVKTGAARNGVNTAAQKTARALYSDELASDMHTAETEQAVIEGEAAEALGRVEKKFLITRKEIADHIRSIENPDITVVERHEQPQLPMSLKFKGKTFAMLYGTDEGVLITARIPCEYTEKLVRTYPEICLARFPNGPNWYYIPVDSTFSDKESVYSVLTNALVFVETITAEKKMPYANARTECANRHTSFSRA